MIKLFKLVVLCAAILCMLLWFTGCAGSGIERKTSLLPDEFYIAGKVNPQEHDWVPGPEWTIGFKWKFK